MTKKKKINLRRKPAPQDVVETPAIITPLHRQDRVLSAAAGAAKGFICGATVIGTRRCKPVIPLAVLAPAESATHRPK